MDRSWERPRGTRRPYCPVLAGSCLFFFPAETSIVKLVLEHVVPHLFGFPCFELCLVHGSDPPRHTRALLPRLLPRLPPTVHPQTHPAIRWCSCMPSPPESDLASPPSRRSRTRTRGPEKQADAIISRCGSRSPDVFRLRPSSHCLSLLCCPAVPQPAATQLLPTCSGRRTRCCRTWPPFTHPSLAPSHRQASRDRLGPPLGTAWDGG